MYQALHRHRPHHRWTNGDLAAKVGADLGLPPDDEQRWLLDTIYAEKAPDIPASFEVAAIAPRQNLKTSTFGVAALADLFVFGVEKHQWSAHHGDTLKDTFRDFRSWIKSNPEYDEQVTFYEGHQDLAIVHRETGNSIDFQSRSGKAGRGLTGVKRITIDEALFLEPKHVGAVYPTMLTRPGAQVRLGGSAGLLESEQWRRVRDRGRAAKDGRLAYVEYGAAHRPCLREDCVHEVGAEGCALDDRELWWQANCALWAGRVSEQSLEDQRHAMPPEEFAREFLSWWDDPESLGGALSVARWLELADPDAERGPDVVFGVHVIDEHVAWVAVAWRRPDAAFQVMLANEGRSMPAFRVADYVKDLSDRWNGRVTGSKALEKEMPHGYLPLSSADFTVASGGFADLIKAGTVRHGNQRVLNHAVKAAKWRNAGTGAERAFQLVDYPDAGPLAAAARALHVLTADVRPFVL